MAVELREPLESLIRPPTDFTRGKDFLPPGRIKVYDDTLRDGEQMPGVAFSPVQKLVMAELFSELGVDVMDVAFPAVGESEREALRLILRARAQGRIRPDVEILAMCRAVRGDIDCVVDTVTAAGFPADAATVLILSTTSDLHLKYKLGKVFLKREGLPESDWLATPTAFYREANLRMIAEAIAHARERGLTGVEFATEDASRADLGYLLRWGETCVRAGGTRLCFSDTVGCLTPEAVDHYFPPVVEITAKRGVELHAHFHNDLGLGAYNCVRALSHGASHAGVTLCGIGERAGNAPLEQVVMQLKLLYGVELPRFRYDLLTRARRLVEECSGVTIQPHMPVVGEGVFSHESGIHTAGIAVHPAIYQFIPEESVGGTRRFVFGKHTGTVSVEEILRAREADLRRAGVAVTPALVNGLVARVKEKREARIESLPASAIIRRHYDDYHSLGVSEAELLALALETVRGPEDVDTPAVRR